MKTISIIVLVITLSMIQEHLCDTGDKITDFFKAIPGEVEEAAQKTSAWFESAWNTIKKPFVIRRLGRGRRRRRKKTTTTTTTSTESFPTDPSPVYVLVRRNPLPLLPAPEWRGIDHWNLLQLPRYALTQGINYEIRRRQKSKWVEDYIGPRPTRISKSSIIPIPPLPTQADVPRNPTARQTTGHQDKHKPIASSECEK